MVSSTNHGLPYPEPSDANDYPTHMQQLAEGVDVRLPRVVADQAARDAIPSADRYVGLVVWVEADTVLQMWNGSSWVTVTVGDHGELAGLGDDDHSQYALADGSRGQFAQPGHGHSQLHDLPPTDPVAGTGGLRTLGSGGQQASPGNHGHGTHGDAGHSEIYQLSDLYVERSSKDSEGVFTVVEWFRKDDNSRYLRSELSGGTPPEYSQRTVTWYEADGSTTRDSVTYNLTYDGDGDLTTEATA